MDADQSTNRQPNSLYTVRQAALLLNTSVEAIRARLNRGTLERVDGEDGRVYVRIDADQTHPDDGHTDDHTHNQTVEESVVYKLQADQIEFLRRELERKDHIILSLTQRIPELEAPSETQRSPQTPSEEPYSTHAPPEPQEPPEQRKRSWWREFLGIE